VPNLQIKGVRNTGEEETKPALAEMALAATADNKETGTVPHAPRVAAEKRSPSFAGPSLKEEIPEPPR